MVTRRRSWAGLTTALVSGSNTELDLNRRFRAQEQARLALHRIRADIHCASAAQAQTIGTYPGLKLAVGELLLVDADGLVVRPLRSRATPLEYQLWRSTATSSICTYGLRAPYARSRLPDERKRVHDFDDPFQGLETVGVDFLVNVNPSTGPRTCMS